jgi:hypothetical protein
MSHIAVSPSGYADLIKTSWILIDVIASHPQLSFLDLNTQYEMRLLSIVSISILAVQ